MDAIRVQFRAPWDKKLTIITGILVVLLGALLLTGPGALISAIIWSIILGCAFFGVYGYSIQEGQLKILRLGWSTDIPLETITKAEVKPHAMMGSIRTFGIGGLFGYIGYFKNSILGSYKAYATNSENAVLIHTKKKQIIVTPDDPISFTDSLRKAKESKLS